MIEGLLLGGVFGFWLAGMITEGRRMLRPVYRRRRDP